MKDFYSFDESSIPYWVSTLFWLIYVAVFVYAVRKTQLSKTRHKQQTDITYLFGVFFALYAVFYCINPDYFRYREWLNTEDIGDWDKEKFYFYLALFCRSLPFDYSFEVFRLIVWGGGIFIVYQTFRMYRELLLPGLSLLLLFVLYAGVFSYARASLAMAVYFIGIAFFLLHDKKVLKLLGIVIALPSIYLHREMVIGIAVLPFLFIPLERKKYSFFSVILLLIVIFSISFVSSNLEYLDQMFDNDDISTKMEEVNEKGQGAFRLSTLIKYLNFFYPFFLITKYLRKRIVPHSVVGMYRVAYGILMASVAFMFVFGLRSVYTYRVMYISMIPLTLLIGYGYCHGYFTKKQFLIIMILALLTNSSRIINAQ